MAATYRLAAGVSLNQIEGKMVLFSMKTGDSFGLNESAGAMIAALLEAGFEAATERCAEKFEVDRGEIAADLRVLLSELEGLGLVTSGC